MPERWKCSVAYMAMVRSKALRMWSWLSIWRMLTSDGCILGKYLSMSSLTCTHAATLKCLLNMSTLRHCGSGLAAVLCTHCALPTLYCCASWPALTKSLISAASSVPVGPPPTCSAPCPHLKALFIMLCACLQAIQQEINGSPALTTTKLRRRRRSSSVVSGRLASSKHALKRSRSALACSASFKTER